MRRFLIEPISPDQQTIRLDRDESRHICKVLRLKKGDVIELFDGAGMVYGAEISELGKEVVVQLASSRQCRPAQPRLHLHAGLLKGKKMELIIQKATELGVHSLQPFISEFTEARPPKDQKLERWQKISLEACKQCGRNWPLQLSEPTTLSEQVSELAASSTALFFWEQETSSDLSYAEDLPQADDIHIFIGPEGGFSAREAALCQDKMLAISLGPLILRAETAVIAGLAVVLFQAGRMKH